MWAVLAWLQILASKNPDESKPLVTVEQITKDSTFSEMLATLEHCGEVLV